MSPDSILGLFEAPQVKVLALAILAFAAVTYLKEFVTAIVARRVAYIWFWSQNRHIHEGCVVFVDDFKGRIVSVTPREVVIEGHNVNGHGSGFLHIPITRWSLRCPVYLHTAEKE